MPHRFKVAFICLCAQLWILVLAFRTSWWGGLLGLVVYLATASYLGRNKP